MQTHRMTEVERLLEDYVEDTLKRNPHVASVVGVHRYDDDLPDGSAEAVEEEIEAAKDLLEDVRQQEGFTARAAEAALKYDVYEMEELRLWQRDPMAVDAVYSFVYPLFAGDDAPLEERLEAIAERLEKTPSYLDEVESRVTDPREIYVEREIEACTEVAPLLQVVADAAGDLERQDVAYRVNSAAEDVVDAFDGYREWLKDVDSDEGWRVGEDALGDLFTRRRLPTPEEVVEIAEKELGEAEMALAEAVEGDGGDAESVAREIQEDLPSPNDVVAEYAEDAAEARSTAKKVVELPGDAGVEVVETPEYLAPLVPLVSYQGPKPYGDGVAKYMVSRPKSNEALREHSRAEIAGRVVSDLYPGHHVQEVYAMRESSRAVSLLGWFNSFGDSLVEGWRDHAEQMMVDAGYHPDLALVHARNRVAAACRAKVDVELHRGGMSVREAVEFLVNEAGMTEEAALQEVRGFASDPGGHVGRVVGSRLIRDRWSGSDLELREFNRGLLSYGGVPVEMVFDELDSFA